MAAIAERASTGESVYVRSLGLRNFRNYASADTELAAGFNVLDGANAQGKTNFLEALYLLSRGRLLRGQRDAEAIKDLGPQARVEATLDGTGTKLAVALVAGAGKRAELNGLPLRRAADLLGRLPSVCVSSEDMRLARGEPSDRRLFLDLELAGLYPAYLRDLTIYRRALDQRNFLVRRLAEGASVGQADFEPWEQQLAAHGSAIRQTRTEYLELLAPAAEAAHAALAGDERLDVSYRPREAWTSLAEGMEALARTRSDDARRGGTTVGPHRDELLADIAGRELRKFGSQGQQRTAVIGLKLATLEVATQISRLRPALLLDDVFSDLDGDRRAALVRRIVVGAGQVVLTCTDAASAGPEILARARIFEVSAGAVTPR